MNTTRMKTAKRPRQFARELQGEANGAPMPPTDTALEPTNDAWLEPKSNNKANHLLNMLGRPEGATLDQMVAMTGWLPHTTRAALTGLKKKGTEVTSAKVDNVRTYRIAKQQADPADNAGPASREASE